MAPRETFYALEMDRQEEGGLVERSFGPASPASVRMNRTLRRTLYPIVAAWRPTRRGVRIARRAFDPGVSSFPPVKGTTYERRALGPVPIEWTVAPRAREADPLERVILYFHGGGYLLGSPRTHRSLVSRLSHVNATPVASVDYRMPPDVPIQGTQADVLDAYRGLLDAGYPAKAIVVAGDSAGGGLAAFLALAAIDEGLPLPAALILLSPWVDLTTGGPSRVTNLRSEFLIAGTVLDRIARVIVPDAAEREFWRNSPSHAPDEYLAKLPPTLIQVGGAEVLLDDGVQLARRIGAAGGIAEVQTYEGQGHVVPMWSSNPDARRALKEISDWLRDALPADRKPDTATPEDVADSATSGTVLDFGPEAFPA